MAKESRKGPRPELQGVSGDDKKRKHRIQNPDEEGEVIDLSLSLTQASSLYIMASNYKSIVQRDLAELQSSIPKKEGGEREKAEELRDILLAILKDTKFFEKEASEVINELS